MLQILWCIQSMQQQSLPENMPDTVMLSADLGAAAPPSCWCATGDSCCSNLKLQRCWCQLRICVQFTCLVHLCWHSAEARATAYMAIAGWRRIHGCEAPAMRLAAPLSCWLASHLLAQGCLALYSPLAVHKNQSCLLPRYISMKAAMTFGGQI